MHNNSHIIAWRPAGETEALRGQPDASVPCTATVTSGTDGGSPDQADGDAAAGATGMPLSPTEQSEPSPAASVSPNSTHAAWAPTTAVDEGETREGQQSEVTEGLAIASPSPERSDNSDALAAKPFGNGTAQGGFTAQRSLSPIRSGAVTPARAPKLRVVEVGHLRLLPGSIPVCFAPCMPCASFFRCLHGPGWP